MGGLSAALVLSRLLLSTHMPFHGLHSAVRVAMGFKFATTAAMLRDFGDFADLRGDSHVRWRTALVWAKRASTDDGRVRRLAAVHRFAEYLRAEDARHQLIPRER